MRSRRAVRRAVWGITAMKRMSTLAALAGGNELQASIAKYKEESENENVDEVRDVSFSRIVLSPASQ